MKKLSLGERNLPMIMGGEHQAHGPCKAGKSIWSGLVKVLGVS